MRRFSRFKRDLGSHRRRSLVLTSGLLVLLALIVAACGQSAPVASLPTQTTEAPALAATAAPSPAVTEIAPTAAALPTARAATAMPTVATAAPTETAPVSSATATPMDNSAPTALPQTGGATATVAVGEAEVELEDFLFQPAVLTVRVGTTVKFSNKDDARHTVTSDTNVFDSGFLAKGDEFRFTFNEPGEYPYYCKPHGGPGGAGMSGTIIVVP